MKVLVADDDPTYRMLLQVTIRKWGYTAVAAADGEEAWQQLCAPDGPRLAVLDWIMPSVDGLEVCRRARSAKLSNYVYIILLTARSNTTDLLAGLEAGADDYLTKPPDLDELKLRIQAGCRILARDVTQQHPEPHLAHLAQLRRLFGELLRAHDEERRAVAHELHEDIAQTLSGSAMVLSRILGGSTDAAGRHGVLSEVISALQGSIRAIRELSYKLHPPLLEETGLVTALRAYGERARQHPGIDLDVHVQAGFGRLDLGLELSLFRIAQEVASILHNRFGCTRGAVRLERRFGEVQLEILGEPRADGRIDPSPNDLSLLGIKERAEQHKGRVEFRPGARKIVIAVTLPENVLEPENLEASDVPGS